MNFGPSKKEKNKRQKAKTMRSGITAAAIVLLSSGICLAHSAASEGVPGTAMASLSFGLPRALTVPPHEPETIQDIDERAVDAENAISVLPDQSCASDVMVLSRSAAPSLKRRMPAVDIAGCGHPLRDTNPPPLLVAPPNGNRVVTLTGAGTPSIIGP